MSAEQPAFSHTVGDTQLIKSITDAVIVTDRDAHVCLWNPGAEQTFGFAESEAVGRPLREVLPAWFMDAAGEALDRALRAGVSSERDFPEPVAGSAKCRMALRVKFCPVVNGAVVAHRASGETADQPGGGRVDGLIILASDCTQLMELERRFMRTERMASIGKLASGVAHELNNPLDGVLRYCNLALGQLEEDALAREYLLRVKEGLHRMARAVKSFLEFSRQSAAPVVRAADINQIIEDVLLLIGHRAKLQHVTIETSLAQELQPVVDSGIQQGISNLIKNAFDAMQQGGTLSLTTRAVDGGVEVVIRDTGEGISPAVQARMYDPFFTTKAIGYGSGLGLTMCKEIVDRSRGRISCDSAGGAGTAFTVVLPYADRAAELEQPPAEDAHP